LAKDLGLVTEQLLLTGPGKVLRALAPRDDRDLALTPVERLAYLAYFLAHDALVLAPLAKCCLEKGSFIIADLAREHIIEASFRAALDALISRTVGIQDRVRLKRERSLLPAAYKGRTPEHKLDLRISLFERLGWLGRNGTRYEIVDDPGLVELGARASDLTSFAQMLSRSSIVDYAGELLGTDHGENGLSAQLIVGAFVDLEGTGGRLTEIDSVATLIASRACASRNRVLTTDVERYIVELSRARPSEFRLHLDRRGRRTLLSVAKPLLQSI
jgi:hypothetical protein